jgi:hypothetical protein
MSAQGIVSDVLASQAAEPSASPETRLAKLKEHMSRPLPDRKEVAAEAGELIRRLDAQLAAARRIPSRSPAELRRLLAQVARKGEKRAASSWDDAAQLYLALSFLDQVYRDALRQAGQKPDPRDEQVRAALERLGEQLAFPVQKADGGRYYDSPAETAPDLDSAPPSRGSYRRTLDQLRELLRDAG